MPPFLVALTFAVILQAQPGTVPRDDVRGAAPSGTISGRITEHDSGHPLPRIVVRLTTVGRSHEVETFTDSDGLYRFEGLEAADYMLSATPEPHRSTHLGRAFGQTRSTSPWPEAGERIALKNGEHRSGIDVALVRSLAIEGRVLDPADQPMADVDVAVSRPDGAPYPARGSSSDDRGIYRVFGLAPGRYHVCAKPQERSVGVESEPTRFARTCHFASTSDEHATDIVLTTENAAGIDIRVQRVGTISVSGSVVDASGTPADQAHISAVSLDVSTTGGLARTKLGQFTLAGLTPGRYVIMASIGGAPPGGRADRELEVGYASIEVASSDVNGVAVSLARAARVRGRVIFNGPAPPSTKDLRLVVQTFRREESAWRLIPSRPPFAAVGDDLSFELDRLYRLPLLIDVQGLPDGWALASIRYDGRDVTHLPVDLGLSTQKSRLEITLTNRVAAPSARILGEDGTSVAGFRVVLLPAERTRWMGALKVIDVTSSSNGAVKLGSILPGDYLIAALSSEDALTLMRQPERIDRLGELARPVTFTQGDERIVEVRLTTLPGRPR